VLKSFTDKALNPLTSMVTDTEDIATEGNLFFDKVLNNAEKIFEKAPIFESKFLGWQKKYTGSKIVVDNSDNFFSEFHSSGSKKSYSNSSSPNGRSGYNKVDSDTQYRHNDRQSRYENINYSNRHNEVNDRRQFTQHNNKSAVGYCIRTGEQIPYDPSKPLTWSAYETWAEFGNPDYREKYCHSCGNHYGTSVRRPLCERCD
jgi:hypothetical protein